MEIAKTVFIYFLFCVLVFPATPHQDIYRSQFPTDFYFGAATSAYQVEGAISEDGRGFNTWDLFTHSQGNIIDGNNADVADDHYHRVEVLAFLLVFLLKYGRSFVDFIEREDIELMHSLGINGYRLSIAWTRILPRGRFGDVNPNGIMFYNKLIDGLLRKGIEPFVTLSHFDVPQELEDRYQSWLSPLMQDDFAYYADICFKNFGDRVKYWITMNEPNLFILSGYLEGTFPPARCSAPFGNCSTGSSEIEPLIAIHNMILAHAKATNIYRKYYQATQGGHLMMVPHSGMYIPFSDSEADREAANRALAFEAPWILDPLVFGDYPPEMRQILGDQLPKFTPEEKILLKKGVDFIGVNHYRTAYAKDCIHLSCPSGGYAIQGFVYATYEKNGIPIGEPTPVPTFYVVPDALEKLIDYVKTRYNNMPIFILENGMGQANGPIEEHQELLYDTERVNYMQVYMASLQRAMRNGADVRGYFVWSLIDNFEWTSGFSHRFGLYYVDYQTQKRTPKLSAKWYRNFITNGTQLDEQTITRINSKNEDILALY